LRFHVKLKRFLVYILYFMVAMNLAIQSTYPCNYGASQYVSVNY